MSGTGALVLVVDASVAVKWYLDEEHSSEAFELLNGRYVLRAPSTLYSEAANVFWKRCHLRREIAREEVTDYRKRLELVPIETTSFLDLLDLAVEIALETGRTVYDSIYVALARRLGCRVVTADRKLFNALVGGAYAGSIAWVGDPL